MPAAPHPPPSHKSDQWTRCNQWLRRSAPGPCSSENRCRRRWAPPRTNCFALWEEVGRGQQKARDGVPHTPHPFSHPAQPRPGPPATIAELEDSCVRVHQQVLGLDVTVTHPLGVDVGQAPEELVHVHLGWAGDSTTAGSAHRTCQRSPLMAEEPFQAPCSSSKTLLLPLGPPSLGCTGITWRACSNRDPGAPSQSF